MRILHIIHNFIPDSVGGTEISTYNLCKKQIEEGHTVYVFCHKYHDTKTIGVDQRNMDGIKIFFASGGKSIFPFVKAWYLKRFFRKCLWEVNPQVIYVHHLIRLYIGVHSFIIDYLKKAKRAKSELKLLLYVHDWWYFCGRIQFFRSDLTLCNKNDFWSCFKCEGFKLKKPLHMLYYMPSWFKKRKKVELLFKLADHIVFESNTIKHDYIKFLNLSQDNRIEVKSPLLNLSSDIKNPIKNHSTDARIRIGYMGTLAFHKGVHLLIQALNLLDTHHYVCEIYGTNANDQYVTYCKSLIKQDSRIYFKGSFGEQDKEKIIKSFSAMVIPSIGHESFCLSLWEATTCGMPVVVPNFGVFKEFLSKKECAIFFERNNPLSLKEKLNFIINNRIMF